MESLQACNKEIKDALTDAFMRHAIENRGMLRSPRQATAVAEQLFSLLCNYLTNPSNEDQIEAQATALVNKGLVLKTACAMVQALSQQAFAQDSVHQIEGIVRFQTIFLEKVAKAAETLQLQVQERSQDALQQALHQQLEQQIHLHEAQKRQNETLNHLLQLSTQLSQATDETTLLTTAVHGFSQAWRVDNVQLYQHTNDAGWQQRLSTAVDPTDLATHFALLQAAANQTGETKLAQDPAQQLVAIILQTRDIVLGGLVIQQLPMSQQEHQAHLLLVHTFAQNLASLWHNLLLIRETENRSKELEILHGRYLDSIWNAEHATLQAELIENSLQISRDTAVVPTASQHDVPLTLGDYPFGHIELPTAVPLTAEDEEFLEQLARELSSALNNAHFLQTARSYSNQLSVAADVSRAATTILDKDLLIAEVVELIRSRFNFYYVGLFLLDDAREMAVLQAGTGQAGQQMVAQGHKLAVGGQSMIGTAVATNQALVEQNVALARFFEPNPYLPLTKAELAIPLRSHGRTIGALTVQSSETGAFSPEGVTVLQSLADQLAISIENANLFAQTQNTLAESTRLYDTSRRINEAPEKGQIYQALIDFAAESGLVDLAQIFVADPSSPDHYLSPVFWSKQPITHNPYERYSREAFRSMQQLETNQILRIEDGPNDHSLDRRTRALFKAGGVCSATMVPIFAEQNWLGTLVLYRTTAVPLNDQDLQPFITLADQTAILLSNQQLLRQTETLYLIGRLLNQSITRDDALDIAVREVAVYTGAPQCRVIWYDTAAGYGFVAAHYVHIPDADIIRFPLADDFVYNRLQERKRPLLLTEDATDIPFEVFQQHVSQFGAKSSLLIPASSQQELLGFLAIDSQRSQRPFNPSHIVFAQTVVDQLVTQIENLKLLNEALQRAQALITLNQIQTNISHYLDINQLAHSVYQQVGRLLDNTIFILARYDTAVGQYQPILYIVDGIEQPQTNRLLYPEEPLYQFLQQDQRLMADHTTPLTIAEARDLRQIPNSGLWIPLQREGKIIGALAVQSYEPNAYDENDVELLRSIAIQTSLAIANAELFSRVQAHNAELMQVDQLKTQFLANMSHELRTPLNSIIGFSRVILKGIDGPITTEQEEDLTSIYSNGQHLLNLINEILDMAKIDAGKMTLSFEPVNLVEASEAVRNTVRGLINHKQVDLIWEVPPVLPLIEADPIRIRQILLNLLSNAAKYTMEGYIQVHVEHKDKYIHIFVKDTGIGIAENDFDKIFAAFEQADSSTTRAVGGTGLGLPITKWLVEMHQGDIYFESELNKGSTFHVILPLQLNHVKEQ